RVAYQALATQMTARKPERVESSAIKLVRRHTDAGKHGGSGGLFGGALGTAHTFRRRPLREHDRHAGLRMVVWPRARQLTIVRGRKAASLRPFLQDRFWIAQRPQWLEHSPFSKTRGHVVPRLVAG